jgi:hypothetical protein
VGEGGTGEGEEREKERKMGGEGREHGVKFNISVAFL